MSNLSNSRPSCLSYGEVAHQASCPDCSKQSEHGAGSSQCSSRVLEPASIIASDRLDARRGPSTSPEQQFQAFLGAIGLKPGDRLLLAHGKGNRRTLRATMSADGLIMARATYAKDNYQGEHGPILHYAQLRELALEENLFFLPSKATAGRKKSDIKRPSDLLYAEIDDLPPQEQWAKWQSFFQVSGLQPIAIIWSGGKSYHIYFRVRGLQSLEEWQELQRMLAAIMSSDPALERPHQPMRLPGFPRMKDGQKREVKLLEVGERTYTPAEFRAGLERTWKYPEPFSERRWKQYARAVAIANNPKLDNSKMLPMQQPEDAFKLPDEVLFPSVPSAFVERHSDRSSSENPWGRFLDKEVMAALERLPIDQQFSLGGFDHEWQCSGDELLGRSPWSSTNSSGTSLAVNLRSGAWYCRASSQGSQSIKQYLQLLWHGKSGRALKGQEFIEFCKRLAQALGIPVPEMRQPPLQSRCESLQLKSEHILSKDEWEAQTAPGQAWIQERLSNALVALRDMPGRSNLIPLSKAPQKSASDAVIVTSHSEGYQQAREANARLIVNAMSTGKGKTSDAAKKEPADWDSDKVMFAGPDPLNPSCDELKSWQFLQGRHLGTYRDLDGNLKRVSAEMPPNQQLTGQANCHLANVGDELRKKNIVNSWYDTVCSSCRFNHLCGRETGSGYGARHQAKKAWEGERIRTSYGRLPGGHELQRLHNFTLILDESSSNVEFRKELKVKLADIEKKIIQLDVQAPELKKKVLPLLRWLLHQEYCTCDRWNKRYGIGFADLHEALNDFESQINIETIEQICALEDDGQAEAQLFNAGQPPMTPVQRRRLRKLRKKNGLPTDSDRQRWEQIDQLIADKSSWRKLPRESRQDYLKQRNLYRAHYLSPEEQQEYSRLADLDRKSQRKLSTSEIHGRAVQLPKRWLGQFLKIVFGLENGYLSFAPNGEITITVKDERHRKAIQAAQRAILLDASESQSKAELSEKYGIPESEIFIFTDEQPALENLTVFQIVGLGSMGAQRGEGLERCKVALIKELKRREPTHVHFDLKNFEHDARLFIDSVGSNKYRHCKSISATPPRPNLGAVLAAYCTSRGIRVGIDDDGFQRHYKQLVHEQIKQLIGRLRAMWRLDEELTVFLLGDIDLPVDVARTIRASEITPEAARKGERTILLFEKAAKALIARGQKVTQSAIAKVTKLWNARNGKGYTQQAVSKVWDEVQTRLQLFLYRRPRKSCSPEVADKLLGTVAIIQDVISSDDTVSNKLHCILEQLTCWIEPEALPDLRENLPVKAQEWVIRALLAGLPPDWPVRRLNKVEECDPGLGKNKS